jgi:hypothetical protein
MGHPSIPSGPCYDTNSEARAIYNHLRHDYSRALIQNILLQKTMKHREHLE